LILMFCLVPTHGIKEQILLFDFGAQNLVYLKNLKPWLQKSKFKLTICYVVSFFYTPWNGSSKEYIGKS